MIFVTWPILQWKEYCLPSLLILVMEQLRILRLQLCLIRRLLLYYLALLWKRMKYMHLIMRTEQESYWFVILMLPLLRYRSLLLIIITKNARRCLESILQTLFVFILKRLSRCLEQILMAIRFLLFLLTILVERSRLKHRNSLTILLDLILENTSTRMLIANLEKRRSWRISKRVKRWAKSQILLPTWLFRTLRKKIWFVP